MKIPKLIAANVLAFGFIGLASAAPTVVDVAGSTTFRFSAVAAEVDLLSYDASGNPNNPATVAYIGSSAASATFSIVHGFNNAGAEIYFRNYWDGSVSGIVNLTLASLLSYIPITAPMSPAVTGGPAIVTGGTLLPVGAATDSAVPDVAFADSIAADIESVVAGARNGFPIASAIASASLLDAGTSSTNFGVAVVPFEWVLGVQSSGPVPFTSITEDQAAALFDAGYLPLNRITGVGADASNFVLLTGRNEDSGARLQARANAHENCGPIAIEQYMLKQTGVPYPAGDNYPPLGVAAGIEGFQLWPKFQGSTGWPVYTANALTWQTAGHSGYNTGEDIQVILKTPNPVSTTGWTVSNPFPDRNFAVGVSKVYFISYAGIVDAHRVGGTELEYNCVSYSPGDVENGPYSLWGYEHIYYLPSTSGTPTGNVVDALADSLLNNPRDAGLPISSLNCSRGPLAGSTIH